MDPNPPPNDDFKKRVLKLMESTLSPYGHGNSVYQRFTQMLTESYPQVAALTVGQKTQMIASLYNNILLPFLTERHDYDFEADTADIRKNQQFQADILHRWKHTSPDVLHALFQLELPRWFAYFTNQKKPKGKKHGL
jgi:hypothetical protein